MACTLNWGAYLADMKAKGFSEDEAIAMMPKDTIREQTPVAIAAGTAPTTLIQQGLQSDDSATRTATVAALTKKYNDPDEISTASGGLLSPTQVIDEAPASQKAVLVSSYLDKHPEELNNIKGKYYTDATTWVDKKIGNDPSNIRAVATALGISPGDLYGAASGTMQGKIKTYYDKWNNNTTEDKKNATYNGMSLQWADSVTGDNHTLALKSGDMILNPADGTYTVIKNPKMGGDQYHPAQLNEDGYINLLKSDAYTNATQKQKAAMIKAYTNDKANWIQPATAEAKEASEGGSGGGGSGSLGKASPPAVITGGIYVETSPLDCEIWKDGVKIGMSEQQIMLPPGNYTIEVRKEGYVTTKKAASVKTYMVNITVTLKAKVPGISNFIKDIGGLGALNQNTYLYLYCTFKARVTGAFDWKTLGETTGITTEVPLGVKADDVLYVYYLITGDPMSAKKLVDDGKVTLEVVE